MALQIEKVLSNRFELSLDAGANVVSSSSNALLTTNGLCDFKTGTGANIIKKQNIDFTDVTVIDTFGGSGTFTFTTIDSLWVKLTELDFFGIAGVGGGSSTFSGLDDTDAYFGNNGKVAVVNESQQKLDYVDFYNINKIINLSDVSITSLVNGKSLGVTLVGGIPKVTLIDKPIDGTTYFSAVGGFVYADLDTQTTPLSYVSGELQLINDISGSETFLSEPPYGVTSVWDESSNSFDFSQLSQGDEVFLNTDINITTVGASQNSELFLRFTDDVEGVFEKSINRNIINKATGLNSVTNVTHFVVKDSWKNNAVTLFYKSDAGASIIINKFHPYIIRKSVNVLDVNDDNFRTFTVAEVSSPVSGVVTNEGTVKISYNGTSNKINNIIFDKAFTKYLSGFSSVLSVRNLELKIFNKTKGITLISNIEGFSYTDVSNDYYSVDTEELITYTAVDVGDKLEVNIDVSGLSTGGGGSDKEVFTATSGQIEFILIESPNNVDVIVNRVPQILGTDFTFTGNTVTMTNGVSLGKNVEVRKFGLSSTKEIFTATASQTIFTLSITPSNIDVVINRVIQIEDVDYTLSGNTVTMTNGVTLGKKVEIRKFN